MTTINEKLTQLRRQVDEIIQLIDDKESRKSVEQKIQKILLKLSCYNKPNPKNAQVFHELTPGRRIPMHERNSHLLTLLKLYEKKELLDGYPEDLNHILHIKLKEIITLMKNKNIKNE